LVTEKATVFIRGLEGIDAKVVNMIEREKRRSGERENFCTFASNFQLE
jgi:hypothetical protein